MKSEKLRRFLSSRWSLVLVAGFVFAAMLPLNIWTQMVMDDFTYCFSFADGSRITGVAEIFPSMGAHYYNMNGRLLPHFFVQLSLLFSHRIFKILNTGMYVLLGLLIYSHAAYGKKHNPFLLFLIYIMIWLFAPAFGQTVLWQTGSINYLWGTCLILLFLLPYRICYENRQAYRSRLWIPAMLILGFAAGSCSENTSGAAFGMAALFMMRYWLQNKKVPLWSAGGLAGCLLGFGVMIAAPANKSRNEIILSQTGDPSAGLSTLEDLGRRVSKMAGEVWDYFGPILLISAVLLVVYLIWKKKSFQPLEAPIIYLLGGAAAAVVMIFPPYTPERSYFGPVILWMAGLCGMVSQLDFRKLRYPAAAVILAGCLAVGLTYREAVYVNHGIWVENHQRLSYVQQQKETGETDIVVSAMPYEYRYCAWTDITEDPEHFANVHFAKLYGFDSAVSGPVRIP